MPRPKPNKLHDELDALLDGRPVELTDELAPLVEAADALRAELAAFQLDPEVADRHLERVLERPGTVVQLPVRRQPSGWDVRRRVVAVALAAALVLAPATMASAAALPGQAMYPFKRAIEQLRIASVQWSPAREAGERTRVADERLDELEEPDRAEDVQPARPTPSRPEAAVVAAQVAVAEAARRASPSPRWPPEARPVETAAARSSCVVAVALRPPRRRSVSDAPARPSRPPWRSPGGAAAGPDPADRRRPPTAPAQGVRAKGPPSDPGGPARSPRPPSRRRRPTRRSPPTTTPTTTPPDRPRRPSPTEPTTTERAGDPGVGWGGRRGAGAAGQGPGRGRGAHRPRPPRPPPRRRYPGAAPGPDPREGHAGRARRRCRRRQVPARAAARARPRRPAGGRQHRRRPAHARPGGLARPGLGRLHPGRAGRRGARLGPGRRDLERPRGAGAAGRARLVRPRRPRHRHPPAADPAAGRGRQPVGGDGRAVPPPRRAGAAGCP